MAYIIFVYFIVDGELDLLLSRTTRSKRRIIGLSEVKMTALNLIKDGSSVEILGVSDDLGCFHYTSKDGKLIKHKQTVYKSYLILTRISNDHKDTYEELHRRCSFEV